MIYWSLGYVFKALLVLNYLNINAKSNMKNIAHIMSTFGYI